VSDIWVFLVITVSLQLIATLSSVDALHVLFDFKYDVLRNQLKIVYAPAETKH
jgi:hypothetical protein